MSSKQTKRKLGRKGLPLTREMLLPVSAAVSRTASLQNHMALVALRQGQGNVELASELLRVVYLTYFLDSENNKRRELHACAECAIKTIIVQSVITGEWRLDEANSGYVATILAMHDEQLASLPLHRLDHAKRRLTKILEKGDFPLLAPRVES